MNNNLEIKVCGATASGKYSLLFLLKDFLREKGFNVKFDGGIDFENESQFDEYVIKNIDKKLYFIKSKNIKIEEVKFNKQILLCNV
jgi:hypothetical protein